MGSVHADPSIEAGERNEPRIGFDDVTIVRGGRKIVERLTFRVAAGEILALLGPSGRGKTSVLHAGAGLLRPASGTVERRTEAQSVLFQEARLLPWMSVGRNVRLGARDRSVYSLRPCPRVDEALAEVGLAGHAGSAPSRLSGGMQRRAALARVLYSEPQVVFGGRTVRASRCAVGRSRRVGIAPPRGFGCCGADHSPRGDRRVPTHGKLPYIIPLK
ncbi:ATP-binding cassette domain-containing protein [Rhodococcus sp. NPDC003383]